MDFISDIFDYVFLQNALIASVCCGVTCGIVGTYVVMRRLVFLSGGVTHASFGGIGIAYYYGWDPIWGALVFSVVSLLGMDYLTDRMKIREDSAIGILWAIGMAVGILFVFLTPGYTPNLMSFLFGNILTIDEGILWGNIVLAAVLVLCFLIFHRIILFTAFDPGFSATQRVPVRKIQSVILVLTAVTIVLTIKLVGIMLLVSLLTIPPIIANLLANSYNRITGYAVAITVFGNITGLYISYVTELPSGASIIIVLGGLYLVIRSIRKLSGTIRTKRSA